jgi:unsaturated rhamnogalacturonyl hydrolase
MAQRFSSTFFLFFSCLLLNAQPNDTPLAVAKRIGDKLIRETPFRYRLTQPPLNKTFDDLKVVDFARIFPNSEAAVAYAYTNMSAAEDMDLAVQTEHNDGCKIWLNGTLTYEKRGDRTIQIRHEERSIELPNTFILKLKKGNNALLIKSETRGKEWRVYLQPPSTKGAILRGPLLYPKMGLKEVQDVDSAVAQLSNWLVVGPFSNNLKNKQRTGLDTPYPPEEGVIFGSMYQGKSKSVTWQIPPVDVLGDLINPADWGTNYHWNYHNGGVAWAMQQLAELSGEKKYDDYASNFCDFSLQSVPFVTYQVNELNAVNSANHFIVNTPLLDFTLAPSLPFIYRLRKNKDFKDRATYVNFIEKTLNYAEKGQIRLPNSNIYTRTTPEKYTTWTDDMFMGIPFLIQAAQYAPDEKQRQAFLDDAALQILNFKKEVWDEAAHLYQHANYSTKKVKMPHWSRANGWGIWAMTEVLTVLPKNHKHYAAILAQYQLHAATLAKWQAKNGFWLNVLDRADAQEEVSGTAIFTMAMARGVTNGWLDAPTFKPVVLRGWSALTSEIEPDGTVHKICMGTMCSEDVNYYMKRPFYDNDTHGLFAVLFAANAVHTMLK